MRRTTGVRKATGGYCDGSQASFTSPQAEAYASSAAQFLHPYSLTVQAQAAVLLPTAITGNSEYAPYYRAHVVASLYQYPAPTNESWTTPSSQPLMQQPVDDPKLATYTFPSLSAATNSMYTVEADGYYELTYFDNDQDGWYDPAGVCTRHIGCENFTAGGYNYSPVQLVPIAVDPNYKSVPNYNCIDTTAPTIASGGFVNNATNPPVAASILPSSSGSVTGVFNVYGSHLTANLDQVPNNNPANGLPNNPSPSIILTCPGMSPTTPGVSVSCDGVLVTNNAITSSNCPGGPNVPPQIASADSQINLNYCASSSAAIGIYTVQIVTYAGTSTTYAGTNTPVTFQVMPTPQIMFNGTNVANNSTPVPVVVGQQIALSATITVNNPSGVTVSSQSWSWVQGDAAAAVGGYVACGPPLGSSTPSSGSDVPLPSPNSFAATLCGQDASVRSSAVPDIVFYWVAEGTRKVTYSFTLSDGVTNTVNVVFKVVGPTLFNIAPALGSVSIMNNPTTGNATLYLSGVQVPGGQVGIKFLASATLPASNNGSYSWVQLISGDTVHLRTVASGGTPQTCSAFSGTVLDNTYPYGVGFNNVTTTYAPNDTATDGPSTNLVPSSGPPTNWAELARSFSATMYLMWNPGLDNSIPVALASIAWRFGGDALNTLGTQPNATTWTLGCGSPSASPCVLIDPTTDPTNHHGYPIWSAAFTNSTPLQCQ